MTKRIPLTQGYEALVDDEDYAWLSQWKWTYWDGYAIRTPYDAASGKQYKLRMHRLITNAPDDQEVDHRNGNRLDNRRANLRLVTHQLNAFNRGKMTTRPTSSRFKGVYWDKGTQKWRVQIKINGINKKVGRFADEVEAAKAYDHAARAAFGEYARLNFPEERTY